MNLALANRLRFVIPAKAEIQKWGSSDGHWIKFRNRPITATIQQYGAKT
jgi:hypothetical protein